MGMLVAIIGGNLQGVEAAYLAKKAGWEVLVIDKNSQAGASLMGDHFLPLKITTAHDLDKLPQEVELVIPALEDMQVLGILSEWSAGRGVPLAFDLEAYALSASKLKSNQLFRELGLDIPRPWPQCDFPVVVKPDGESGSRGVMVIHSQEELTKSFPAGQSLDAVVAQAYLAGPSYSIEVIGSPGNYHALQITELQMDGTYDCRAVLAPAGLDSAFAREFEDMALRIADHIQLKGLMDVEVILHNGQLKVLEVDARVPSQTPTAVYHSTGINMVEFLGDLFITGSIGVNPVHRPQAALYEHVQVTGDQLEDMGERVMSGAGPLKLFPGLFGADEVISNFRPDLDAWVATLIIKGQDMQEVLDKKQETYINIHNRNYHG